MKIMLLITVLFVSQISFAATKADCLAGNYKVCKEIFEKYGSSSDKAGAVDFFVNACTSQNLKISCQVISTEKSETLKKGLEVAGINDSIFVMSGPKVDKIYKISEIK